MSQEPEEELLDDEPDELLLEDELDELLLDDEPDELLLEDEPDELLLEDELDELLLEDEPLELDEIAWHEALDSLNVKIEFAKLKHPGNCPRHFGINPSGGVYPLIVFGHVIIDPCGLVILFIELQVGQFGMPGLQVG